MGFDSDDGALFTLTEQESAEPVARRTLVRQSLGAAVLLVLAAAASWVLPAALGSDDPERAPGLMALGTIVLVPLTLGLAGLVLVVAVATALVQSHLSSRR